MARSARRERWRRERERDLLDIAAALNRERPWSGITVDEIAERAQVAKGTVYLHFRSKDELRVALVRRDVKRLLGRLVSPEPAGDPGRAARFLVAAAGDFREAWPESSAWLLGPGDGPPERAAPSDAQGLSAMGKAVLDASAGLLRSVAGSSETESGGTDYAHIARLSWALLLTPPPGAAGARPGGRQSWDEALASALVAVWGRFLSF